ncbi:MAG: PAS domain S-box protein [Acidobacteria bacterium]|nr:PAS domain S-box protein [Acidobacteriota bacterium]
MPLDAPRAAHAERRLTVEYVAARALAESTTLAEAGGRVLRAICETLGWDHGGLWHVDASAGVLRCKDTWHRPAIDLAEFEATSRRITFTRGVGLPGRVWASGEPAWVPDVVEDANFPRAGGARRGGLHGAFALPLLIRGNVVGVMEFFSRDIREPDEYLLGMLTRVGAQVGAFIERRRVEEELDRFFTLSLDLLCVAGFDGYFKRLNPAWERVLGYTSDELLARPYLEFVHPDDRAQTTTEADKLSGGGQVLAFENRYRAKDGAYRWLEWAAVPYPSEQTIYAAARDITERKDAQATIARYSRDLVAARQAQAEDASRLARLVSELEVRNLLNVARDALQASDAPAAIEVISARPDWVELLIPCTREAAEQIQPVVARLGADLPADVIDTVSDAFRELLLNAVEWGGQLDPTRKVRVSCVRTNRVLIYRIADPGPGFQLKDLDHAAIAHPEDPIEHVRIREEKGLRPGGFGILLVRAKVDELVYNEKQNEVIFVKYLN